MLAGSSLLETFRLTRGMHVLGTTEIADLLLSTRDTAADLCRLELSPEGLVTLRSLDDAPIRRWDGVSGLEVELRSGDFAELAGLRLVVLENAPRPSIRIEQSTPAAETAPSDQVRSPTDASLALRVKSDGETRLMPVDQPLVSFGRGTGNTVSFSDSQVSRRHARLILKADGPWIEDLGSGHGTYLDGAQVQAAAWPLGSQVRLSRAAGAPTLELLSKADALADSDSDDAVMPLLGACQAMRQVRSQVLRYAKTDATLLVLGETGTGKELVAQALARLRGPKLPFQAVNCGAIPEQTVEGRLFGHRKGAFTGAIQDVAGDFEAAGEGTLFLDEIGELPLAAQVKILRALEAREIQRLGDTHTRPFKARVIAGTHRDLGAMVAAGQFREDLYHRLAVLEIRLPPLRNRLEDLPALALLFLRARSGRSARRTLSVEALEKLCTHRWPGNVREAQERGRSGGGGDGRLRDWPRGHPVPRSDGSRGGANAAARNRQPALLSQGSGTRPRREGHG